MNTSLIGLAFTVVWLVLAIPALVLLLRSYGRTKMGAFLWLAGALFGWPLLVRLMTVAIPTVAVALGVGTRYNLFGFPGLSVYVAISLVGGMVGGVLLLIGLFTLDQQLAARMPNRQVPPPLQR